MKLEHKNFNISSLEVKQDDNGTVLEGYGAFFNNEDSYSDIIEQGAFADTIKGENRDRIAFCYQHNMSMPIGKIEEMFEDEKGLFVKVRISESETGIATKVKEGILKEMSIGYIATVKEYDDENDIRKLKKIDLFEISLVTRAANPMAVVTSVKADDFELKQMEDEELKALADKIDNELKSRQPQTWLSYLGNN